MSRLLQLRIESSREICVVVRWQISQQRAKGFSAGLVLVADSTSRSMAPKAPEMPQKCACSCFSASARISRRNFGASLHKMAQRARFEGIVFERNVISAEWRSACVRCHILLNNDAEHVELGHLRVPCDPVVSSRSGLEWIEQVDRHPWAIASEAPMGGGWVRPPTQQTGRLFLGPPP